MGKIYASCSHDVTGKSYWNVTIPYTDIVRNEEGSTIQTVCDKCYTEKYKEMSTSSEEIL